MAIDNMYTDILSPVNFHTLPPVRVVDVEVQQAKSIYYNTLCDRILQKESWNFIAKVNENH
jgi:hypothetical protein